MKPKIGITTKAFDQKRWYEQLQDSGYSVIEIGRRSARIYLDPEEITKILPHLEGIDLSMHSATCKVFTDNAQFTRTELEILKSEVLICNIIKAKELIFHLKHDKLSESEAYQLRKIIDFAQSHDVEMIFESNGILVAEVALNFLQRFPDVNYNLDLGHLNNGLGRGMLGMELDEFIRKIKDRTVYVHAHNNSGKKDEHKALPDGTLNWRHVLDLLDMKKIRKIIMEVKTEEDIKKSKTELDRYFNSKNNSHA